MTQFTRDSLSLGALTLTYERFGTGPVIICVHGGGGMGLVWRPIAKLLANRFTVICPNMAGVAGTSGAAGDVPPEMNHETRLLEAMACQFSEPVYLVGHSYGANIVLSTAIRGDDNISGLTAIEATPVNLLSQCDDDDLVKVIRDIVTPYMRDGVTGREREAFAKIAKYMTGTEIADMPPRAADFMIANMAQNRQAWRTIFSQTETPEDFAGLATPVHLINAEYGPPFVKAGAKLLAKLIPNNRRTVVPESNHLVITSHPDLLAREIARHASQCF